MILADKGTSANGSNKLEWVLGPSKHYHFEGRSSCCKATNSEPCSPKVDFFSFSMWICLHRRKPMHMCQLMRTRRHPWYKKQFFKRLPYTITIISIQMQIHILVWNISYYTINTGKRQSTKTSTLTMTSSPRELYRIKSHEGPQCSQRRQKFNAGEATDHHTFPNR